MANIQNCFGIALLVIALLAAPTASSGATISVAPLDSNEQGLVTVTGPVEYSDIEQFRTKTALLSKAVVAFASDGGNLVAGIEIGTMLRLKGFASIVPDGARCASACALAWLGGVKRLMGATAQIGFHAAYIVRDGVSTETSTGNALVGAYLNRIGLPDRAVIYITQAAPQDITWLNLSDAAKIGIDVELFSPAQSQQGINTSPPVSASPSVPDPNAAPQPRVTPGRFARAGCGSISDANTGLEWLVGPDRDMSWPEAVGWASSVRACGKTWNMPSASELRALFDRKLSAGIGYLTRGRRWPAHLDPIFAAIGEGSWVWTERDGPEGRAAAFNFNQGLEVHIARNGFPGSVRAFAVNRDGGASATVVRRFYAALRVGNGDEATQFISPEKRNGHFSAGAITNYYSRLRQPLTLTSLKSIDGNSVLVHYRFESNSILCDGSALVTTTVVGGETYIARIKALNGC